MKITSVVDKAKAFEQTLIKFSDILIASTSAGHDEINFWEPKTLAPYEPLLVSKIIKMNTGVLLITKNKLNIRMIYKVALRVITYEKMR